MPKGSKNTHINSSKTLIAVVFILAVLLAIGSFVISFTALSNLALLSGIPKQVAWIWPLVVDGFIIAATLSAYVIRGVNKKLEWYPWVALLFFALISIVGNGIHAFNNRQNLDIPVWLAAGVSSIPPIALLVASHLLMLISSHRIHADEIDGTSQVAPTNDTPIVPLTPLATPTSTSEGKAIEEKPSVSEPVAEIASDIEKPADKKPKTTPRKRAPRKTSTRTTRSTSKKTSSGTSKKKAEEEILSDIDSILNKRSDT